MSEKWKPVLGYEGEYEISNKCQLRRASKRGNWVSGKVLSTQTRGGYHRFQLCLNGKRTMVQAHRVVWEAFVGKIPDGMQINHKNGDKTDNRLNNLEVVTPSENIRHSWGHLGHTKLVGSKTNRAKLKESDIPTIFQLHSEGKSQRKIAERFGVSQSQIWNVLHKRTWSHVSA